MTRQPAAELVALEQGFDYQLLDPALAKTVRAAADHIRSLVRQSLNNIIRIGRDLEQVKKALGHGRYGPWLEAEFGWSDKTARRYRAVAAWLFSKMAIVSDLQLLPTAAYRLAAASAPATARQVALERALTERITPAVARAIIAAEKGEAERKRKRVHAARLHGRLNKLLKGHQQRCRPESLLELAAQLRQFADALVANKPGSRQQQ